MNETNDRSASLDRPSRRWLVMLGGSVCVISLLHYITSYQSIELHELFQRMYYVPIVTAAVLYGIRGGLICAAFSAALFLPHVVLKWHAWPVFELDQYAEIVVFTLVGAVTGVLADRLRAERDRCRRTAMDLDTTCRRLEASVEERLRADRLVTIGRLASGIAHAVRTPLGGLLGSLEILGADLSPTDRKSEFLAIAKNNIGRVNKTVTDFIEFARPPAPIAQPADARTLLETVVRLIQPTLAMQGGSIEVENSEVALRVRVDVHQIERALMDILLDETLAGHAVRVSISADWGEHSAQLVISRAVGRTDVKDVDDMFEPFPGSDPGAGLTLAMARRLVENQGGSVRAEMTGSSLRYVINLPLAREVLTETAV